MQNQVFKLENETFIFLSNNFDSPKQEHTKWEWKTLVIQRDSLLCIKHQKFGNQQRKIVIPSDKEQKKYRNMIANMKYNYENPLFKTN